MKKRDSRDRLRQGGRVLLLIYLACVVYFMFFSEAYGRTDVSPDYRYNLVLFREIRRFCILQRLMRQGKAILVWKM